MRSRSALLLVLLATAGCPSRTSEDAGGGAGGSAGGGEGGGAGGGAGGDSGVGDGGTRCDGCTVFVNGRVFDGRMDLGIATVVVERGLVARVEPGVVHLQGASEVDLTGKTLLPGLIELHAHFQGTGAPEGFSPTRPPQGANIKQMLRAGFTSFLDLGGDAHVSFAWRQRLRDGHLLGPRMFSVGPFLEPPQSGHCPAGLAVHDHCLMFDSPASVAAQLPALLAQRPDALKITIESGNPGIALVPFTAPTVRALVAFAADAGLPLVSHVNNNIDFALALDAGVPTLTHMPLYDTLSPALVQQIAARRIPIVTTLVALEGKVRLAHGTFSELSDPNIGKDISADVLAALRNPALVAPLTANAAGLQAEFDRFQANFRLLVQAGAVFLFGSDSGYYATPFGLAQRREFLLMVQGGMTPAQALTAATAAAADFLKRPDLGRIAPGAIADLLVVRGNPLMDITAIAAIDAVYLGGTPLDVAVLALDGSFPLLISPVTGLPADAACLATSECGAPLRCNAFQYCAPGCTMNAECAAQSACYLALDAGVCLRTEGCLPLAQDCLAGANCVPLGNGATMCLTRGAGLTGAPCTTAQECSTGLLCVSSGECRQMCNPAVTPTTCPPGQTCVDGTAALGVPFGRCL